jgi:predicted O-methyltransferase YrrM
VPAESPLRIRVARSLGPVRPALKRVHDGVFAGALPRRSAGRLRRAGAPELARAVEGIAGRGLSSAETEWVRRIEERRNEIAAIPGPVVYDRPDLGPPADWPSLTPASVAQNTSVHRPWGTLLMRLVRELRPRSCLELGTGAGISGAYIAAGLELNGSGRLLTIDGSTNLTALAREGFDRLGLGRAEVRLGDLDEVLRALADEAAPIDLAFFDAGKRAPNQHRFLETVIARLAPGAVLVIDDIHWSRELARAWAGSRRDSRFDLATDLWRVGLLRLRGAPA